MQRIVCMVIVTLHEYCLAQPFNLASGKCVPISWNLCTKKIGSDVLAGMLAWVGVCLGACGHRAVALLCSALYCH